MKIIIGIYLSLIVISLVLATTGINVLEVNVGMVFITLFICYGVASFGSVNVDQIAGMFLFGKPVCELKPGLYFAPLGIISVKKFDGTEHLDELPGPPEKIYNGDGEIPKGMFAPIRIKFGQAKKDDPPELQNDPYNHAMVASVVPVIRWKINEVMVFAKQLGTEDNCRQILTNKAIAIFGDDLAQVTPAKALLNLRQISQNLENDLKDDPTTQVWGITIIDAYLKPIQFTHKLNDAVLLVPKAEREKEATRINSEGEEIKRMNEGKGAATARKAMLIAEAEGGAYIEELLRKAKAIGIEAMAEKCKTSEAQTVLWMETLQKAFETSKHTIIPGSELFTAVSGIKTMLDKISGGTTL